MKNTKVKQLRDLISITNQLEIQIKYQKKKTKMMKKMMKKKKIHLEEKVPLLKGK